MPPRVRKLALTVHVALSVGWIGAVAAYLALDVTAVASRDPDTLRAAYLGMHVIAVRVIVPLAVAALVSGILMAIGTPWGLFRHYWVLVSLLLTMLAAGVLLVETSMIRHLAAVAADPATSPAELQSLGGTLVHSIGGLGVLLGVLALNMYKPRGVTRYGWRQQQQAAPPARKWSITI